MEVKPITRKELFACKCCKLSKDRKNIEIKRSTFEEAKKMNMRKLCILVGLFGLRLRPVDGSLGNANYWLNNQTKEELLDLFRNEFIQEDR